LKPMSMQIRLMIFAALFLFISYTSFLNRPIDGALAKSNFELLQGKWRSVMDLNLVHQYGKGSFRSFYSGELKESGKFKLFKSNSPKKKATNKDGKHLVVTVGKEVYEYSIIQLTASSLKLAFLPMGTPLVYKKIK